MLGLYHPISSPMMTRMFGFLSCAKDLVAERTRARIREVTIINFVFINAARHRLTGIASAYDKEIASGHYGTLVLRCNASDKSDQHKSTRTTVATVYALVLNEKNLVALSSFQCLDSTLPDSFQQRLIIALVLIGVGERKPGDGFIEARV